MRLSYSIESLSRCWGACYILAEMHWQETEGYRHGQPFCPDRARYEHYEKLGFFFMAVARNEGQVVGYAGMYVMPSMHTQEMIATEDTWFLVPGARKGRNAIEFYSFVERECRRRGAVEVTMTTKLTNDAGRILKYLGYEPVATQHSKSLKEVRNVRSVATPSA